VGKLVRLVLVAAVMELLGGPNWRLPRPLAPGAADGRPCRSRRPGIYDTLRPDIR
jgi:hypothetical protein